MGGGDGQDPQLQVKEGTLGNRVAGPGSSSQDPVLAQSTEAWPSSCYLKSPQEKLRGQPRTTASPSLHVLTPAQGMVIVLTPCPTSHQLATLAGISRGVSLSAFSRTQPSLHWAFPPHMMSLWARPSLAVIPCGSKKP